MKSTGSYAALALAAASMGVIATARGDNLLDEREMKRREYERGERQREMPGTRVAIPAPPTSGSIAGRPHANAREIARRQRQAERAARKG